jgi:hypothetical protein
MLYPVSQVKAMIAGGKPLLLAASEWFLAQLPRGNWIGGTIPYFMDLGGGVCTEALACVDEVPDCAESVTIRQYSAQAAVPSIWDDQPANGYSFLLLPGGSPAHRLYAQAALEHYASAGARQSVPVIGWVTGVHVSRLGLDRPRVFNGLTGESTAEDALVAHVALPPALRADLETVNVFQPGDGDSIVFPNSGFSAAHCLVNGQPASFPAYLRQAQPDPHVPLTTVRADGRVVNVSIQGFDEITRAIHFYAPVFAGTEYRFAQPVPDYAAAFDSAIQRFSQAAAFSCNCILNYLYGELEGKRASTITGPVTFGEIAGQLLNQTMVQLLVRSAPRWTQDDIELSR